MVKSNRFRTETFGLSVRRLRPLWTALIASRARFEVLRLRPTLKLVLHQQARRDVVALPCTLDFRHPLITGF